MKPLAEQGDFLTPTYFLTPTQNIHPTTAQPTFQARAVQPAHPAQAEFSPWYHQYNDMAVPLLSTCTSGLVRQSLWLDDAVHCEDCANKDQLICILEEELSLLRGQVGDLTAKLAGKIYFLM